MNDVVSERPKGGCPICGNPKHNMFKPFCSKRCADVDLNRWFTGGYAIAAEEEDTPDDAEAKDREA